jgi:glycosyltransferase involved in cell wall biosynthesis
MNLLVLDLIQGYGGAEKYIAELCKYLESCGHTTRVVVSNSRFMEELQRLDLKVTFLRSFPLKTNVWRLPWFIHQNVTDIHNATNTVSYDAIINNSERGLVFLAGLRRLMKRTRIIHFCHTTQMSPIIGNWAASAIDKVVCVSEHLRNRLPSRLKSKSIVIPNGFQLHDGNNISYRPVKKEIVVGIACIVAPLKSIETALYALQDLATKGKRIHLKLALVLQHAGEYENRLRALIKKMQTIYKIDVFENVNDIHHFFSTCHVVLSTSISKFGGPETFGRTIVEGWDAGCAVISSYCGGPLELIQNGENGLFFEEGNSHLLAEKVQLLYDNENLYERIRAEGNKSSKLFSIDIIGKKILEIISDESTH